MPRKARVTSKDVANRAGVSQTTVSFVLNNVAGANISAETSERVWRAAQELGYVPDVTARNLARGYNSNIGLMIIDPHAQVFIDEYLPNVMTGLMDVLREYGFRLLIELVNANSQPQTLRTMARGKEVAGMVVMRYSDKPEHLAQIRSLSADGYPLVTLSQLDPKVPSVSFDHLDGVRQMTEHLISMGHETIGCISYGPPQDLNASARVHAFRQTMRMNGLTVPPVLIQYGAYDPETAYAAAELLLNSGRRITAIQCLNDMMAVGAMRAVQERGLRVPEDIAIVGFDDIRLARFTTPPLTTIHVPEIDIGYTAGQMLLDLIHNRPLQQRHAMLPIEMVVRGSCGA